MTVLVDTPVVVAIPGVLGFGLSYAQLSALMPDRPWYAVNLRDLITDDLTLPVTLVDVGALGTPAVTADVPRERIFELAETTLDAVRKKADRGGAVTNGFDMSLASTELTHDREYTEDELLAWATGHEA